MMDDKIRKKIESRKAKAKNVANREANKIEAERIERLKNQTSRIKNAKSLIARIVDQDELTRQEYMPLYMLAKFVWDNESMLQTIMTWKHGIRENSLDPLDKHLLPEDVKQAFRELLVEQIQET
jgi:hypothetical protein